jgi:hypothetical protein
MGLLQNAFEVLGVDSTSPDSSDEWCAEGALLLLAEVSAVDRGKPDRDMYKLVCGLFLLVFCDHFTRLQQADKERCASIALSVFAPEEFEPNAEMPIVGFHNDLASKAPALLRLVGDGCATWTCDPTRENLDALRMTFVALLQEMEDS